MLRFSLAVVIYNSMVDPDALASAADSTTPAALQSEAQGIIDYTQNLIEGEEFMFIMDVPTIPAQDTPIVLVQAATAGASTALQPDYILKACTETMDTIDPTSAMRGVDPAYMLTNYLNSHSSKQVVFDLTTIKTTLLQGTKHGNLVAGTSTSGRTAYRYDPTPNYIGNDRAVFQAVFEGKVYKIVVDIKVLEVVDETPGASECEPPRLIKVTKPSSGDAGFGARKFGVRPYILHPEMSNVRPDPDALQSR